MSSRQSIHLNKLFDRQEKAWREGRPLLIESFANQLPESVDRDEALLDLISNEIVLREQVGETPTLDEYQIRFPDLADKLRIQWEIDRLFVETTTDGHAKSPPDDRNNNSVSVSGTIGRFELIREVGRGAIGVVYQAWDPLLKRTVAVKRLRAGVDADPWLVDRVIVEAESIAKVQHPHIVQIYDVSREQGQPFLAMEYCHGRSLEERLKTGPLDSRISAELMAKIARGIAQAHACLVIHRDLKPGNVLLARDQDWTPKVTDFGLAKRLDDDRNVTATGNVLGTPAYMAPEQARGGSRQVGPAADIYSIGAILYECLTGRPPFHGATVTETLDQVRNMQPISIRLLQPGVPRDLETICQKCLEKEPWRRYVSASDLADDLDRFLSGRPILARRVGMAGKVWRWSRRNPTLAALLTTVSLLVTIIAIGSTIAAIRLTRETSLARTAERQATASDEARRNELVRVYISEARTASAIDGPSQRQKGSQAVRHALAAVPWPRMTAELRSELVDAVIPCLTLADFKIVQRVPLDFVPAADYSDIDIDIDLDLQYLARPNGNTNTTILQRITGPSEFREFSVEGEHDKLARYRKISRGGTWLSEYRFDPNRLLVWNRANRELVLDDNEAWFRAAFHPDERHILYHDNARRLRLFDLKSGAFVSTSPDRFRDPHLAFSHDGKLVAVASRDMPAEIIDPVNWQTITSFPQIGSTFAVTWHPNETQVFFGAADGRIYSSQRASNWTVQWVSEHLAGAVNRLVVSPDARLLAASDLRANLVVSRLDGRQIFARLSGYPLRFSSDSRRVAVAGLDEDSGQGHLTIFEINESPVRQIIPFADNPLAHTDVRSHSSAEFSRDGRWLGISGQVGVLIHDARTLKQVADLGLDFCGPVAFHPAGDSLITFGKFSQPWIWPFSKAGDDLLGPPVPEWPSRSRWNGVLAPHHGGREAVWSADGTKIAFCDYRKSQVVVRDQVTGHVTECAKMRSTDHIAMSPDGRWIAVSDRSDARVVVSDTLDGSVVYESPFHSFAAISFDGSLLATRNERHIELVRLGTWQRQLEFQLPNRTCVLPLPMVFQPGGTFLAVAESVKDVGLYDYRTGKRIVVLDDREDRPAEWLSFSPDGTRLAVTRPGTVAIWDLGALSRELFALGLHIDQFPDQPRTREQNLPVSQSNTLVVDRGSMPAAGEWYKLEDRLARGEATSRQWPDAIDDMNKALRQVPENDIAGRTQLLTDRGRYFRRNLSLTAARDDWRNALELSPENSTAAVELARLYVVGPKSIRDPRRAIQLANDVVSIPEHESVGRLLSAIARVRLNQTEPSDHETLDTAISDDGTRFAIDWRIIAGYVRAMDKLIMADVEAAKETMAAASEAYHQHRNELTADVQLEIDTLLMDVDRELQRFILPD